MPSQTASAGDEALSPRRCAQQDGEHQREESVHRRAVGDRRDVRLEKPSTGAPVDARHHVAGRDRTATTGSRSRPSRNSSAAPCPSSARGTSRGTRPTSRSRDRRSTDTRSRTRDRGRTRAIAGRRSTGSRRTNRSAWSPPAARAGTGRPGKATGAASGQRGGARYSRLSSILSRLRRGFGGPLHAFAPPHRARLLRRQKLDHLREVEPRVADHRARDRSAAQEDGAPERAERRPWRARRRAPVRGGPGRRAS